DRQQWQEWAYRPDLQLKHVDHAGVGTLELCDAASRLAAWRYTLAQNPQALRLIKLFEQQRDLLASGVQAEEE
ncbi:hypothetical protein, partial [Escherichia coli]